MTEDEVFDKEPSRYLRLSIKDPFLKTTPLVVKVNDSLTIIATVEVKNITKCKTSISYDHRYFLLKTPSVVRPGGSYSKDVRWKLQALKISSESLWIEITAEEEEGGLTQVVGMPVTIS